jgi:L-ascorbate metabolism protein UlaG (beta-lactamase superfamily)
MQRSPNYKDGRFQNPVPTREVLPGKMRETLWRQVTGKEQRVPPGPLPLEKVLVEIDGHRVLVDPVFAERASPSQAVGPKRFHPPPMPLHVMPRLDAIILTHDHYDHLDMYSVGTLVRSVTQEKVPFITTLGVGAHLERWGVPASRIVELDWWESTRAGALTIAAGWARHFSGRGLTRNRTLWAAWSIIGPTHRVFHSGDTGEFDGLAENGRRYGPFDIALIKIGAYGETWPDIHLTPEQAVRACTLVQGKLLLPIHWGTFNLAFHPWDEPAERVLPAAQVAGVPLVMPRPGESVEPASPRAVDPWWRSVARR